MQTLSERELSDAFVKKCAMLKEGRFLMSKDRISGILRFIAGQEMLYRLLTKCNQHFDYAQEFKSATNNLGNTAVFKLPQKPAKLVALVTGLLYEFDRGTTDFHQFISRYFSAGTANEEFTLFCDSVMIPYQAAVVELLAKGDRLDVIEETPEEIPMPLSGAAKEQLLPLIGSLTEYVLQSNLPEAKSAECIAVLEGFYYAAEAADERMVRALWIGVKNTMTLARIQVSYLKSIEDVLVFYALI